MLQAFQANPSEEAKGQLLSVLAMASQLLGGPQGGAPAPTQGEPTQPGAATVMNVPLGG